MIPTPSPAFNFAAAYRENSRALQLWIADYLRRQEREKWMRAKAEAEWHERNRKLHWRLWRWIRHHR